VELPAGAGKAQASMNFRQFCGAGAYTGACVYHRASSGDLAHLAKRKADDPTVTERFEPFIVGWEMANGFTELNDPIDQKERFRQQVEQRKPVMMRPI
jgi:elongation factor P--beta-lysine ligase